jgi:hypothetical protein
MSAEAHGPLNPQPPHEYMREAEASVLAFAERQGWGKLVGSRVLGDVVVYTFERGGTRIKLPGNARTE